MLDNYLDKISISIDDMKDYLYLIDPDYQLHFSGCKTLKAVKEEVKTTESYYLFLGLAHLQNVRDFTALENHLVMMNHLFGDNEIYHQEKVKLKKKILKLNDPVNQYRVLRHIMNLSPGLLIESLSQRHYINYEQAAYFSIVEEDIDEAYRYLSMMDHVANDALLDLFSSYTAIGYLRLLRYYDRLERQNLQVSYS